MRPASGVAQALEESRYRRLWVAGRCLNGARWRYASSLVLAFAVGVSEAAFGTMPSAIVLRAAPDKTRGRVMGVLSACIGTQPLGVLWAGFLASRVGAPGALAVGAALALGAILPVATRLLGRTGRPEWRS